MYCCKEFFIASVLWCIKSFVCLAFVYLLFLFWFKSTLWPACLVAPPWTGQCLPFSSCRERISLLFSHIFLLEWHGDFVTLLHRCPKHMQSTDSSQYLHLSLAETLTAQVSQGKLTSSILLLRLSGTCITYPSKQLSYFAGVKENNHLFPLYGEKRGGEKLSQNSDVFS